MIEKAAARKRWICPISPIKAGQPMAPTAIGRRRPDSLDDDQAVGVDDVDEEECLPGNPSQPSFGKNETTLSLKVSEPDSGLDRWYWRCRGRGFRHCSRAGTARGDKHRSARLQCHLFDRGAETLVIGILPIFARIASARIIARWRSPVVADF